MIQTEATQTLAEFVEDRLRFKDVKDGIKIIDAPHIKTWIIRWN